LAETGMSICNRNRIRMNREGFPCGCESDSRIVLEGRPV
jgi:hypothetical protein